MKTRIVKVGNSHAIRIPKQILEQTGLNGEVEIRVVKNGLLVTSVVKPRTGWAEAARKLVEAGEGQLLMG